jgi:hypothetical protein
VSPPLGRALRLREDANLDLRIQILSGEIHETIFPAGYAYGIRYLLGTRWPLALRVLARKIWGNTPRSTANAQAAASKRMQLVSRDTFVHVAPPKPDHGNQESSRMDQISDRWIRSLP